MTKKIFIISGEVSGDVLGAEFIREVRRIAPDTKFVGIGGNLMEAVGLQSLFPISDLAVMGVGEVLKKLRTLRRRIRETVDAIIKEQPDIVVTIDSTSFTSRVGKIAKRRGVTAPIYQIVAPMTWIWGGERRAKKYPKSWDKLFAFFDFEKPLFEKYGLPVTVIGYPFYTVTARERKAGTKKYVALLPGSRMGAASKVMPIFKEFAAMHPELDFAIPTTEITRSYIEREAAAWAKPPKIIDFEDRYKLYNQTKWAVSFSGTATAELAIMHIPTVIVWRKGWLTEFVVRRIIKIKWFGLLNIIADREIFPELIGKPAVTAAAIDSAVRGLNIEAVRKELSIADKLWHKDKNPMEIVAREIVKLGSR